MREYPKMLYRPRAEPNSDLGGQKLDTLIVNSLSEEKTAAYQGWVEFNSAIALVKKTDRLNERIHGARRFYERWEWALKALAVVLALAAGTIGLVKAF